MMPAAAVIPETPSGAKGWKFAPVNAVNAVTTKNTRMPILTTTMTAFARALPGAQRQQDRDDRDDDDGRDVEQPALRRRLRDRVGQGEPEGGLQELVDVAAPAGRKSVAAGGRLDGVTPRHRPSAADVALAARQIHPHVRRTPVLRAEVDGRPLVLKLEHLQRGGSFKLRGAVTALARGPRPEHVVTASGGNHGIAVATAAALLGLPATVYVPAAAPEGKTRRIEAAGARLVRHGATYGEAAAAALGEARTAGVRYVPAYDDPAVVAGQGTATAEAVADAPEVDAVVVAAGGGGLAAGAALAAGGRAVVVVEPEGCCCVHRALAAGRPVDAPVDSVAASALGATRMGEVPFAVLAGPDVTASDVVSVLVTDAELRAAQDRLWDEFRLAVEPAAAVPFAAWLAGRVPGERACLVLCGANT
jgi:threonine dehydratase